jgi:hypothetical protein
MNSAAAKNLLKSCLQHVPNPIKPSLTLPAGACDAHCHVFGPASRFPYTPDCSYTPPDAPVEHLRALHATPGVSRAVIVHASCHGTDMAVTLDAIASSRGAYRGVAGVDDAVTDGELRGLHDGGIRGIRFNFVKHLGGVPDLDIFHRLIARINPWDGMSCCTSMPTIFSPSRIFCDASTCPSSSTIWDGSRVPTGSSTPLSIGARPV